MYVHVTTSWPIDVHFTYILDVYMNSPYTCTTDDPNLLLILTENKYSDTLLQKIILNKHVQVYSCV